MSGCQSIKLFPGILALSSLLCGCAAIKDEHKATMSGAQPGSRTQTQTSKAPVQPPAIHQPQNQPSSEPTQPALSPRRLVEGGEYQKALDEYDVSYRKRPRDQALTAEYAKSLEDLKSAADKACEKEEYSSAGRTYDLLLKHYGQFKDFAHLLTFDRAYLNNKLSLCKKSLSVRGFQEYRKGNLGEAILLWQGLLSIDPNNEDIKKAMITATEQQRNLRTKK
jgi:tetratricopeptide (TPR) repeat protein